MPKVSAFLTSIRDDPNDNDKKIGVAGFCWGGQHVVKLVSDDPSALYKGRPLADSAFMAHPSLLDFKGGIASIKRPVSVAIGTQDFMMTPAQTEEMEALLRSKGIDHDIQVYPGAGHGFSVRIDRRNEKQTEQAVKAEKQAVDWFKKCFGQV